MVAETMIALGIAAAVQILFSVIGGLIKQWGSQEMPETIQAEMSDTDQAKIRDTQRLMADCFGDNVTDRIRNASNKERIALMADFAERLAREYDLDIEVDVTVSNLQNCGAYNWKEKKAVFNIALLMVDGDHEQFAYCVRETLDTIIHELRHAVQHKSIEQPGFWNVEDEVRNAWANNMASGNYIRPEVDMRAYAMQPIERDAVTFAALVMKGVDEQ